MCYPVLYVQHIPNPIQKRFSDNEYIETRDKYCIMPQEPHTKKEFAKSRIQWPTKFMYFVDKPLCSKSDVSTNQISLTAKTDEASVKAARDL